MTALPAPLAKALWRGLNRRCPRCGEGALFERWIRVQAPCECCGVRVIEDEGDPWAFLVVADRIFVLLLVVLIYFQFAPGSTAGMIATFAALTVLFVVTTPNRFGLCLALAWLVRRRLGRAGADL